LTLLRSVKLKIAAEFRAAVVDPEQQGSQCLGRHKFNYAVFPHPGNWQQGDVYGTMEHYVLRPHLYQVSKHNKGTESKNQSLFSLQPNSLQLSAIKKTEQGDGIVIRLFNPTDKTIEGNIKLARKPQSAVLVNLNEDLQGQLPVDENGVVTFDAEPCKIITIKCTF